MRSSSKWPTLLIVLFTVGLVLGPVFIPREVSRWYLAAAANAYRKQDTILGKHYLERAVAWDPTVEQESDYLLAQLPPIELQTLDGQLDLIEKVIALSPVQGSQLALRIASELSDNYDFMRALRAVNMVLNSNQPLPEPLNLHAYNLRAYNRALAGVELEDALTDIDRAIKLDESFTGLISQGPDPALLDTKAWVLHRLDRNEEALDLLNEAIPRMDKQLSASEKKVKPSKLPTKTDDKSSADEQNLNGIRTQIAQAKNRLGTKLFSLGVLRFHRLRVLQALNKSEESQADQQWLEDYDIPIVDELF